MHRKYDGVPVHVSVLIRKYLFIHICESSLFHIDVCSFSFMLNMFMYTASFSVSHFVACLHGTYTQHTYAIPFLQRGFSSSNLVNFGGLKNFSFKPLVKIGKLTIFGDFRKNVIERLFLAQSFSGVPLYFHYSMRASVYAFYTMLRYKFEAIAFDFHVILCTPNNHRKNMELGFFI